MKSKPSAGRAAALFAVAAIAILSAAPVAGAAEWDTKVTEASSGPKFSANAGYASDYRYRGFTQTREKPALQGGVDVTWRKFYIGIWASNVDFGRVTDALGRWHDAADLEVDTYLGLKQTFGPFETDLRVTNYAYPGAFGLPQKLDYLEIKAGLSREIMSAVTADLQVYYSPDNMGETGPNWVVEGGLARKLGTFGSIAPSLSVRLAYSAGDEAKGGFDYWYWNAGISMIFADYFELDLRYFDTFDVPAVAGSCRNVCDGRIVARITFEN
jgi:uncharacterized protein (TIGR02001 family)